MIIRRWLALWHNNVRVNLVVASFFFFFILPIKYYILFDGNFGIF